MLHVLPYRTALWGRHIITSHPSLLLFLLQGKRFDGTWQEGTPKCGSYSEIHTPPAGTPGSLPPIELKQPEVVLGAATRQVLEQS